ncbi:hypothetical protein LG634_22000 [Streptomyces bambusae]|uniref:hypothetical protein n=1 Tax=Streptomyces bambusae TaxID=1550616 RepID=UPI001CFCE7D1|nr:hypothetical protein [Streptomyces bambusae]MCB5167489.1 hypothetical protein [Streptomyces bambusae]
MSSKPKRSPVAAVAVLALACGLGAVTPAHAAGKPSAAAVTRTAETADGTVSCTAPSGGRAGELASDIAQALRDRRSTVSLALDDGRTGTSCVLGPHRRFDAASVVKPIILGALLWTRHGDLTPQERQLSDEMITRSDNDAASALWRELSAGPDGGASRPVKVQQFLTAAHMNATRPSPGPTFGLTRVTAPDLIRLLRVFDGKGDLLTPASRAYAMRLMAGVDGEQRWGTPAGAPAGSGVHVKNGWLQRSDGAENPADRGDWKINSMAAFTGATGSYRLVVLTENNRVTPGHPAEEGYRYGIATIEGVAVAVHRGLARPA